MAAVPDRLLTYEEYCEIESNAPVRSEFLRGRMFAMAGGTYNHARIAANLSRALGNALAGTACVPVGSDLRLQIAQAGLDTYADLIVVCGVPEFATRARDCITNPKVVFEVLSPGSERYDRGKKFEYYSSLASLGEYVLIAQDQFRAEVYFRKQSNQWLLTTSSGHNGELTLESIGVTIPLAALYDRVEWESGGDVAQSPPG